MMQAEVTEAAPVDQKDAEPGAEERSKKAAISSSRILATSEVPYKYRAMYVRAQHRAHEKQFEARAQEVERAVKREHKELTKELKDLKALVWPESPIGRAAPDAYVTVLLDNNWSKVLAEPLTWIREKLLLVTVDDVDRLYYHDDVPELVRQSVPGMGLLSEDDQVAFMSMCRDAHAKHIQGPITARQQEAMLTSHWVDQSCRLERLQLDTCVDASSHQRVGLVLCLRHNLGDRVAGLRLLSVCRAPTDGMPKETTALTVSFSKHHTVKQLVFAKAPKCKQEFFPRRANLQDTVVRLMEMYPAGDWKEKPVWAQNAALLLSACQAAEALAWEHLDSMVWDDVLANMHLWYGKPLSRLEKILATKEVGHLLFTWPAATDADCIEQTTTLTLEDDESVESKMERAAIKAHDLFTLTAACHDFTTPFTALCNVTTPCYGAKREMHVKETISRYLAFQDETLNSDDTSDILLLDWHLLGTESAMGHYVFCVVEVATMSVVLRYDGLLLDGCFDFHPVTVVEYHESMIAKYPQMSMATMQVLKASARRPGTLVDNLSRLKDFKLPWQGSWETPWPIAPLKTKQRFPTCSFDTCHARMATHDALCIRPNVWPQSMQRPAHAAVVHDVSFRSDSGALMTYEEFLRNESMTAMCLLRTSSRAGGVFWPGSAVDSTAGLPLCAVTEHTLGLVQPDGLFFAQGQFDMQSPTTVASLFPAAGQFDIQSPTTVPDTVIDDAEAGRPDAKESVPQTTPVATVIDDAETGQEAKETVPQTAPKDTLPETVGAPKYSYTMKEHGIADKLAQSKVAYSKSTSVSRSDVASPGRSTRANEVVERKDRFARAATVALSKALSGQLDSTPLEWIAAIRLNQPEFSEEEAEAEMHSREERGKASAASILWMDAFNHPGMKTVELLFGGKCTDARRRQLMEEIPVPLREYEGVVPLLAGLGRVGAVVGYQYFGPGSVGREAELVDQEQVVFQVCRLLQC
jgi:hypothetical protein